MASHYSKATMQTAKSVVRALYPNPFLTEAALHEEVLKVAAILHDDKSCLYSGMRNGKLRFDTRKIYRRVV